MDSAICRATDRARVEAGAGVSRGSFLWLVACPFLIVGCASSIEQISDWTGSVKVRKSDPVGKLRVLTLNVKMLPGFGGLDRARRITRAIRSAEPPYDLVCMQEVFDEDVRGHFVRNLRGEYPFILSKFDGGWLAVEDSGLFIASRYPIEEAIFERFDGKGPFYAADFWAAKGVSGARLDLSELEPGLVLYVFNTHLHAAPGHPKRYQEVRQDQIRQVRDLIAKTLGRLNDAADAVCLLLGDMNVVGEDRRSDQLKATAEYRRMLGILERPRDLFREGNGDDPGFTWDPTRNRLTSWDGGRLERLDYILVFDTVPMATGAAGGRRLRPVACPRSGVERFGLQPSAQISDHFGVGATIAL